MELLERYGQMVSSSALEITIMGSVTCQQIWDQFWQSQRALIIVVQCRQMVGSSALGTTRGLASAGRWSARLLGRLSWEV